MLQGPERRIRFYSDKDEPIGGLSDTDSNIYILTDQDDPKAKEREYLRIAQQGKELGGHFVQAFFNPNSPNYQGMIRGEALDVGSARGTFAWELARGLRIPVIGIDSDEEAVKAATAKSWPQTSFSRGDANKPLNFPEGRFGFVNIHTAAVHFKNPGFTFQEAYRVVNKGGKIGVTDAKMKTMLEWFPEIPEWKKALQDFLSTMGSTGVDLDIADHTPNLLRASGFQGVTTYEKVYDVGWNAGNTGKLLLSFILNGLSNASGYTAKFTEQDVQDVRNRITSVYKQLAKPDSPSAKHSMYSTFGTKA